MTRRRIVAALIAAWLGAGLAHEPGGPPDTVSDAARAWYERTRPRAGGELDLDDPATMARMRRTLNLVFRRNAERLDIAYRLEEVPATGFEAVWVRAGDDGGSRAALLYLHGGGYILGSARANLSTPVQVAAAANVPVLSVDYRLAPEHPFPAARDDALAAYRWLLDQGIVAHDIGVFGDSAGGGLALALVLAARDAGLPLPGRVAVLSPLTDLTGAGDTRATLAPADPIISMGGTGRYAMYLGGHPADHPQISPVYADYRDFPPLLIQVGTREVLLSDAARLARRARADGADVTLDIWDGMWHVWQDHPGLPEAQAANRELAAFLTKQESF